MRRTALLLFVSAAAASSSAILAVGCDNGLILPPGFDAGTPDAPAVVDAPADTPVELPDVMIPDTAPGKFCSLPGSIQFKGAGVVTVPGGSGGPDLSFLKLPPGFCAHHFGQVNNARQLRFAPGGELFVASPTTGTTGGGPGGQAAIVILPDDNADGYADKAITFLGNLPSTQGLLFTKTHFYYQDSTKILRMPYAAGQRAPAGASEEVVNVTVYSSGLHWPKTMDQADDGTIYVTNGGDQGEACVAGHPFRGGVLAIDGSPGGKQIAKGTRNPIGMRCTHGANARCFAVELSRDYSGDMGGREKLVPIHEGDDWGFPCCATQNLPYPDVSPVPNCAGVKPESDSFLIGHTPFDVDFAPASWPAPWTHRAFVTLHGIVGSWVGARVVGIAMDANTGLPLSGTDLPGGQSMGAMADFATGWDDNSRMHGRPAEIAFASDGRMFLASDTTGEIFWVAPLDM